MTQHKGGRDGSQVNTDGRYELADLRWAALDAGDVRLFAAYEEELERRDIEDGALILLAA